MNSDSLNMVSRLGEGHMPGTFFLSEPQLKTTVKGNWFKLWLLVNFSYIRVIQSHPPTPVRISKCLAIPPTPLPLRNIKMAPKSGNFQRIYNDWKQISRIQTKGKPKALFVPASVMMVKLCPCL